MIDALARIFGIGPGGQFILPGDVLGILALASLVVLSASTILAGGAIALRARTVWRARTTSERYRRWQGLLHAVLYDGAESDTLWSTIDAGSRVDFLGMLVQYARRLDGDERDRICALAEPHLSLILKFVQHGAAGRRMRAVQTLGELGLPRYGGQIIAALDDPSPLVAMVAASTLARGETPEYAVEVLGRLDRFSHWRQDFLAAMLGSMGAGAAPALRDTLLDAGAPTRVRAVAADALATVSDPLAANAAQAVLNSPADVELRAASLRLLASVGRAEHLAVVRESLTSPELPVRLAAIRALGRFGVGEDLPPLEEAAKEDPSPWVAIAAARALQQAGGNEAIEALAGSEHPRSALGLQVISEARSW